VSARAFWAAVLRESVYGPTPPVVPVDLPRLYLDGVPQAHVDRRRRPGTELWVTVHADTSELIRELDRVSARYRKYTFRERWTFRFNEFMIAAIWGARDLRAEAREHAGELVLLVGVAGLAGVGASVATYCAEVACW
jgi:hypothetical protein